MSLTAPCEGMKTVYSTMGLTLRPLGKTMPPAVGPDLTLEVVPSPVVDCFFGIIDFGRPFDDEFGKGEI